MGYVVTIHESYLLLDDLTNMYTYPELKFHSKIFDTYKDAFEVAEKQTNILVSEYVNFFINLFKKFDLRDLKVKYNKIKNTEAFKIKITYLDTEVFMTTNIIDIEREFSYDFDK